MATPHPQYTQPGPSSLPYHPSPPLAFGGNSPYPLPHQHTPNAALTNHPQRLVNGVGRATYGHQGSSHPGPTFHPHFHPHQTYQAGIYHPIEHQHHARPPPSPYQQQHSVNGGSLVMGHSPSGPFRQGQFIHTNPRQPPPPFSPPFHSHVQHYSHSSPSSSPSALPKQLLMPPPSSPLQSQPLPTFPAPHVHSDTSLSVPPEEAKQYIAVVPSFSAALSPALQSPAPVHGSESPLLDSHGGDVHSPSLISHDLSVTSPLEASEPFQAFPDRSNTMKGLALQTQRPSVSEAVPFTVSSAARPPQSYYDSVTTSEETETLATSHSPQMTSLPLTPPPDVPEDVANTIIEPDSPPQQSLPSSATTATTPATSTAPHTPTPGSPHSSMTSVSLPTKSPSRRMLEVSPSPSVKATATDTPAPSTEVSQYLPTEDPVASSSSNPTPPPVKKTWASLLRPSSGVSTSPTGATGLNGLPTSSVQGFSIPASLSANTSGSSVPHTNADLVTLLTAPNTLVDQLRAIRARGIVNLGNMCFANTVLQALAYCPPFNRLFSELDKYVSGSLVRQSSDEDETATPLVNATVTFIKEFRALPHPPPSGRDQREEEEDNGRDSFVPNYVYDALKTKKRFDSMRGGQQEDAEEFLGFYLDTLEEELLYMITSVSPASHSPYGAVITPVEERVDEARSTDGWLEVGKKNKTVVTRTHKALDSPISRIFGGKFRTALKVPGARETAMVDPWSRLQLDIQPDYVRTIEDALRNIATPGTVQVTSSSRPGVQVDATQQTMIETLPPVLVLHLKRFLYDTTVNDVVKLSKKVAFGTELEIPKEIMVPTRRSRPARYKMIGVLNHHGSSATGGHYTLDVLHPDPHDKGREGWIRIDDEFVQNIRAEDLPVREVGDDRSAYLLFYRRVHPPVSEVRI